MPASFGTSYGSPAFSPILALVWPLPAATTAIFIVVQRLRVTVNGAPRILRRQNPAHSADSGLLVVSS